MYNNTHFAYSEYAPHRIGVDKIRVHTRDFEIKNTLNLAIQPNAKLQGEEQPEPTLLFSSGGEPIYGSKAYHNTDKIKLDINGFGLSLTYNPTKYNGENKLISSGKHISQMSGAVETYLQEIGVHLNVNNSKITRLDVAKDREMSKHVYQYSGAFSTINGKRTKQRVLRPDGYRLGNRQRQGIFYDKGKEQHGKESNLMRGEYKSLNSKEVQRSYGGMATLNELHQIDSSSLDYYYTLNLKNHILHENSNTKRITNKFAEINQLSQVVREARYFQKDLFALLGGAVGIIETFGSLENYRLFLLNNGKKRQNADKVIKELQGYLQQAHKFSTSTIGDDLQEIRNKFIAA